MKGVFCPGACSRIGTRGYPNQIEEAESTSHASGDAPFHTDTPSPSRTRERASCCGHPFAVRPGPVTLGQCTHDSQHFAPRLGVAFSIPRASRHCPRRGQDLTLPRTWQAAVSHPRLRHFVQRQAADPACPYPEGGWAKSSGHPAPREEERSTEIPRIGSALRNSRGIGCPHHFVREPGKEGRGAMGKGALHPARTRGTDPGERSAEWRPSRIRE
jgi:hypothetical protein